MSNRKKRRHFTSDFKNQIVKLYQSGKPKIELIREYELTPSALDRWIKQATQTGSFKHKDNLSDTDKELINLRKRNQQLEMENDILKQAALIMDEKASHSTECT